MKVAQELFRRNKVIYRTVTVTKFRGCNYCGMDKFLGQLCRCGEGKSTRQQCCEGGGGGTSSSVGVEGINTLLFQYQRGIGVAQYICGIPLKMSTFYQHVCRAHTLKG